MMKSLSPQFGYWSIILILGVVWLHSGVEKLLSGNFPRSLGKTLTFFANGAPNGPSNPYPWFKSFLLQNAVPQSQVLGHLIQWSELLIGVALIALVVGHAMFHLSGRTWHALFILPLLGAALMNLMFWLAAGWTGVSTAELNVMMLLIELAALSVAVSQCLVMH